MYVSVSLTFRQLFVFFCQQVSNLSNPIIPETSIVSLVKQLIAVAD